MTEVIDQLRAVIDHLRELIDHLRELIDHLRELIDHLRELIDHLREVIDLRRVHDDQRPEVIDHLLQRARSTPKQSQRREFPVRLSGPSKKGSRGKGIGPQRR